MRIELNKEFKTREELDAFVRSRLGDDPKENKEVILEVSEGEAQALSVDATSNVYGTKIKIKK